MVDGIKGPATPAHMLQKQQQTLQQMSNMSKMLHDTALAVIRKIG